MDTWLACAGIIITSIYPYGLGDVTQMLYPSPRGEERTRPAAIAGIAILPRTTGARMTAALLVHREHCKYFVLGMDRTLLEMDRTLFMNRDERSKTCNILTCVCCIIAFTTH
jgi:hypothetical protein